MRRVSITARDGHGEGSCKLTRALQHAGSGAGRSQTRCGLPGGVSAGCPTRPERPARDRRLRLARRRLVRPGQRTPANCAHDQPSCGGPPGRRDDLQPAGLPGRFRRGDSGLLAPGRRSRAGRLRRLRSSDRGRRLRRPRGLLDALDGRRGLRLDRRRRRGRCGSRRGGRHPRSRRQERERVDVPLVLGSAPNAEVHVRLTRGRVGALADDADARALGDLVPALDGDRAELQQRHGIPVGRTDRQRATTARDRPHERHAPRRRRAHRIAERASHVDPAMLSARVRVRAEDEGSEHRPVDRPRPGLCAARKQQREQHARDDREPTHRRTSFGSAGVNDRTSNVATAPSVVRGDDANVERSLRPCYRERS